MSGGAQRPPSRTMVEEAYRKHGATVLRRARAILGDEAEAKEVLQDVFKSLLEGSTPFEQRSALTTWLYAITTNACLTRMRNRRTRQRLMDERQESFMGPVPPQDAERWAQLRQLLERLPEHLGVIAIHYFLDEMTQQEIARLVGCSRSQVGNLIKEITMLTHQAEGVAS
jgi:RNA polymerase sigma factor (sigma-70 family)